MSNDVRVDYISLVPMRRDHITPLSVYIGRNGSLLCHLYHFVIEFSAQQQFIVIAVEQTPLFLS
jgi:hypothetical protein